MPLNQMRTLDELINVLELQIANLPTYQAQVGATNTDIQDVGELHANLVAIRDHCEVIDAGKLASFGTKALMFNGPVGQAVSVPPTIPVFTFATAPVSGARELTLTRNKRFALGPAYTKEIGEALGIEVPSPDPFNPVDAKPTISLFPAAANHHFSCVVEKREAADMWQVWIQRKGGNWELHSTYSGKSADVSVSLTTPGEPEQILVRVQLRKNNEDYGQPSDPVYVTLNP